MTYKIHGRTDPKAFHQMPWEILRSTKLTPDGRGIDFVTKGGSLPGYYSNIAMVPEFGLGITILVAGVPAALGDLAERVHSKVVELFEEEMRSKVRQHYAGYWSSADEISNLSNWSLTLKVDDHGPGLLVTDWISNGTNFLPVYGRLRGLPEDESTWEARLLPAGVSHDVEDTHTEIWRLTGVKKQSKEDSSMMYNDFCITDADALIFSGKSIEEFKITKHGRDAFMLYISGMRTQMLKHDSGRPHSHTDYQIPGRYFRQDDQQVPLS